MNTHAILCCLVKPLNHVVYEHILIERVTEEVKRTLTIVNINRVFTQSLTLVLLHFIKAARTSLLNNDSDLQANNKNNNNCNLVVLCNSVSLSNIS